MGCSTSKIIDAADHIIDLIDEIDDLINEAEFKDRNAVLKHEEKMWDEMAILSEQIAIGKIKLSQEKAKKYANIIRKNKRKKKNNNIEEQLQNVFPQRTE